MTVEIGYPSQLNLNVGDKVTFEGGDGTVFYVRDGSGGIALYLTKEDCLGINPNPSYAIDGPFIVRVLHRAKTVCTIAPVEEMITRIEQEVAERWSIWIMSNLNGDEPVAAKDYDEVEKVHLEGSNQFAWRGRKVKPVFVGNIINKGKYGKLKICNSTKESVTLQIGGTKFNKVELNQLISQLADLRDVLEDGQ